MSKTLIVAAMMLFSLNLSAQTTEGTEVKKVQKSSQKQGTETRTNSALIKKMQEKTFKTNQLTKSESSAGKKGNTNKGKLLKAQGNKQVKGSKTVEKDSIKTVRQPRKNTAKNATLHKAPVMADSAYFNGKKVSVKQARKGSFKVVNSKDSKKKQ